MTKRSKTKVDELKDALKKKRYAKEVHERAEARVRTEDEGGDLGEQIRSAEKEAKEHYDKLLRVMAEFENFKRRMTKERDELVNYGNEKLLSDLLPTLDDLDRVLDHVPEDASEEVRKFVDGVELVRKTLLAILEKYNLKEVPALGEEFDPSKHEAIAAVESDAHEPNAVMAMHRKGYWLGDRLLRPAMVTVAKA